MLIQQVKQKFILPASSCCDGFYERLVRSVKIMLKKTLGKALLTYEDFEACICETEDVINTRPLTYVIEDDLVDMLTVFHLMLGRNILRRNTTRFENFDNIKHVKCCKHLLKSINDYRKWFTSTYLNELRQFHIYRNAKQQHDTINIYLEDIALIKEDFKVPRTD